MSEFSLIIKNASVVDGSGKAAYRADIGVKGDRVVVLGDVKGDSVKEIDAKGLIAIPGFIDSHSHGDMNLLFFPECESYVFQGVTTMIAGQCGMSLAPIGENITLPGIASEHLMELEPYKYYPSRTVFPRERVNQLMKEKYGWTVDWSSMADWYKRVEDEKISMNMASLVGHVTVRRTVMEDDFKRPATKDERDEMGHLIRQSLDEGAIGLSVGLDYDPDTFADREELVEHCKIAADYGSIFVPHSRRTGRRRDQGRGHRRPDKIDAIIEVIDLCRGSGVKMNIAHLFTGWYVSPSDSPDILEEANRRATLAVIDKARAEGLDISFDILPSSLVSIYGGASFLCSGLEPWIREKGSRAEFARWLRVKEYRDEIKDAIYAGKWFTRQSPNTNPKWAEGRIIFTHNNEGYVGKSIAEIASDKGIEPFEAWFDLVIEDPDAISGTTFTYPSGKPSLDASYNTIFWDHPTAALGIDTSVFSYEYERSTPVHMLPMINFFAAFPSFIQKFVKTDKHFTLEQAVFKTSTQPADRHGLEGRGRITPGSYADIVLLDMESLHVNSTPIDPKQKTTGLDYVIVNGEVVVRGEGHTGARPGKVLRRE
jgi:N-acyl-D-aspartate/D-glutamate deacylase